MSTLVVASLVGTGATASADEPSSKSILADSIAPIADHAAHIVPSIEGHTAIDYSTEDIEVTVPNDPSDGIELAGQSGTITVALPNSDTADDATVVGAGTVGYDNHDGSTTVPVVVDDGSVKINTVIDSSDAPTEYRYAIGIPAGGSLVPNDDGTVSIVGADREWIGGVAAHRVMARACCRSQEQGRLLKVERFDSEPAFLPLAWLSGVASHIRSRILAS